MAIPDGYEIVLKKIDGKYELKITIPIRFGWFWVQVIHIQQLHSQLTK